MGLREFGDIWIDIGKLQAVYEWGCKADVLLEHGSVMTIDGDSLRELRKWLREQALTVGVTDQPAEAE